MIYIDFDGLVNLYQLRSKQKLTISVVAEETGITRKALSWLRNHPTSPISSEHLGTLAEYFFHRFLPLIRQGSNPALLMNWIISTLVQVYPDHPDYKGTFIITQGSGGAPVDHSQVNPSILWTGYQMQKGTSPQEVLARGIGELYSYLFEDSEAQSRKEKSKDPIKTKSKKK